MNTSTAHPSEPALEGPARCHRRRGRGCGSIGALYIAAIVAGFIIFWPIGLALLVWAIWRDQIKAMPWFQKIRQGDIPRPANLGGFASARRPSNAALADYLAREQDRLKAEQEKLDELVKAFEAFKEAERNDRDRRDFENFLRQRGESPTGGDEAR